ncbi:MAG TPA: acetyltransferase [Rubrivivax sp.]|nr:acetyltransferase [Rubrivivax sp.]
MAEPVDLVETRPLLIFPFNGNGLEALDCLGGKFQLLGFVDDTPAKQSQNAYGSAVFSREALVRWPRAQVLAVPGGPASFQSRRAVIDGLGIEASRYARVIHPSARISPLATIGHNVLIMAGVVITSNAVIGDHVCVLPNTVIHHDSTVGSGCLVGSNVSVAGNTAVGENCYIATGSSIMNGLEIGAGTLVGLGSTVIRSVPAASRIAGNPARPV